MPPDAGTPLIATQELFASAVAASLYRDRRSRHGLSLAPAERTPAPWRPTQVPSRCRRVIQCPSREAERY